jgi:gluconolactonase
LHFSFDLSAQEISLPYGKQSVMKFSWVVLVVCLLTACSKTSENPIGTFELIDASFSSIVSSDAKIEIIGEGYEWSEGPLWVESQKMLLFSDVPKNTVYKWSEKNGVEVYLTPSGFTGDSVVSPESGSNGLFLDDEENLLLCQCGDRRIAIMNSALDSPSPDFTTIADTYNGKRFNSPNDGVFYNYNFYFTDPPYGLAKQMDDPMKEIPFQGVYVAQAGGEVNLIVDSLTRPNGLAFLKNKKTLIVANSDPDKAKWYAFDLAENDSVTQARVFFDVTENAKTEKGLPDGLKVDSNGNVFATGPGGVWIFNSEAKILGKIKFTDFPVSNCSLSSDEKTLYLTADMYVLKVTLRN